MTVHSLTQLIARVTTNICYCEFHVSASIGSCYRHFRFKSWYASAIKVQTLQGLHVDRFCWL